MKSQFREFEANWEFKFINAVFKQKYLTDVKNVCIIEVNDIFNGFLLLVETEDNVWFIPLLENGNEQYGFKNREVYSARRMQELCNPKEATVIAYGKEVECEPCATMAYHHFSLPVETYLKVIGATNYRVQKDKTSFSYKGDSYEIKNFREEPSSDDIISIDGSGVCYADIYKNNELQAGYDCFEINYANNQLILRGVYASISGYILGLSVQYDRENSICYIDEKKEK